MPGSNVSGLFTAHRQANGLLSHGMASLCPLSSFYQSPGRQQTDQETHEGKKYMSRDVARESDHRFRVLIEHSNDAIALLTPEGPVTYVSASIERILGYTPQECMTINAGDVFHPSDLPALADLLQHLLTIPGRGETRQVRCRRKDGTWRWVEATVTNLLHDP